MNKLKKAQFQISVFHLLAIVLSIILVVYVGISQNKISIDMVTSNTEAQHLQLVRRMFMSQDCLAYESRIYTVFNHEGLVQVYSSRKITPFVVDLAKFYNWENFNCIRNVVGSQISPTQFRSYKINITNLENGETYFNQATIPRVQLSNEPNELSVYASIGVTKPCTGKYYYDTIPVLIYDEGRFYNGLAYIEDCILGQLISKTELYS